jgi:dihydrofolate synthase/folylpolyglutamate synthase
MTFSNLNELFSYIESFTNLEKGSALFNERTYRLDRMHVLLERFNHPERAFKTIHLAGTKGKGSTAAFVASALRQAGYRTGLYTSPHVSHYWERIDTGEPAPEAGIFIHLGEQIREVIQSWDQGPPTTFELLTLLAFCLFREKGCTYGVIETGIGGRLDATNVVHPELCLITPIELEHTEVLGNTLEQVAREKGGIIKPGVPVFSARQEPQVRKTLQQIAQRQESEIHFIEDALESMDVICRRSGTEVSLRFRGIETTSLTLAMIGNFQAENAALAFYALGTALRLPVSTMRSAFRSTVLPARMELIVDEPPIVLDSAHTPRSVGGVLGAFQQVFGQDGSLIFGSVAGKDTLGMARILAPAFRRVFITTPGDFKESHPQEVYRAFKSFNPATLLVERPEQALRQALKFLKPGQALLITGSFYLAAEVQKLMTRRDLLGQAPLQRL